jgi:hypothetical protein
LLEGFGVVVGELDLLPPLGWQVGAFDGLDVEVEVAGSGVGADGSIATVGEGTGLAGTETCDVVLVSAESLVF